MRCMEGVRHAWVQQWGWTATAPVAAKTMPLEGAPGPAAVAGAVAEQPLDSISTSASSTPRSEVPGEAGRRCERAPCATAAGCIAEEASSDDEATAPRRRDCNTELRAAAAAVVQGQGGRRRGEQRAKDLLSSETALLVKALASVYAHLASLGKRAQMRTAFHSQVVARMTALEYLTRIAGFFQCSDQCLVLSLVYVDRVVKRNRDFVVSPWSMHRVIFTSVMVAVKFWDDTYFSNSFYAKIGGVTLKECCALEAQFLQFVGWRLAVEPLEYDTYLASVLGTLSQEAHQDYVAAVATKEAEAPAAGSVALSSLCAAQAGAALAAPRAAPQRSLEAPAVAD